MKKEIKEIIKETRSSSFNLNNYRVTIEFRRFVDNMLLHTWYDKTNIKSNQNKSDKELIYTKEEWLDRITPKFQRQNNKWSKKMKIRFIENLLNGANTELLFFRINERDDAQVIDGLQRTTAIIDFFNNKIKVFGYSCDELNSDLRSFRTNIQIKIYTFNEWKEVGKFYIDMNENITHSKADIQKAKDWFLKEHQIEL